MYATGIGCHDVQADKAANADGSVPADGSGDTSAGAVTVGKSGRIALTKGETCVLVPALDLVDELALW